MKSLRNSILRHVVVRASAQPWNVLNPLHQLIRASSLSSEAAKPDQVLDRVISLVKKFDKIDASKVTETADFQKELCLDSLDKVELVMAFEEEFCIEIPDDKADKFTCCADVAKYIASESD